MARSSTHRLPHAIAWLVALLLAFGTAAEAQLQEPSQWSYTVENATATEATLCFTCHLEPGWHIYSTTTDEGGPLRTEFTFTPSANYKLQGKIKEGKPIVEYDELFGCTVRSFTGTATFRQTIKRNSDKAFTVGGTFSFQLCTGGSCIAPDERAFTFEVPAAVADADSAAVEQPATVAADSATADSATADSLVAAMPHDTTATPHDEGSKGEQSLLIVFLIALAGGLLTMITPCVFPMVPMTVNYFVRSNNRAQAWLFGGSIVFIFAVLGALLTLCFGSESLYFLGTHWIPNLIFFVIFLIFSLSFFGLFELRLPQKWSNDTDAKASRGGWVAPFFMALTTVLVSFSCTGPILGAALVGLATSTTNALVSLVTMLGFGIGFAAPFTLLALFPRWLRKMKSGSWLGTVKIVFAFLELAFGLKFLSMADLYCGWHLLDREVYLALWIVIFALLGFYLLGKLRFKGEEPLQHIGVVRLFLVIIDFAFVVYMVPGMFGAPLKAISGFLPPMETQDFNLAAGHDKPQADNTCRYADLLSLPDGFTGYFTLEEAQAESARTGKPIFIDFTGKTCANCREMEHYVWADSEVRRLLTEHFIICALYVDENTIELPENEWLTTQDGRTIKTLGRRNLEYQKTRYQMNAQPYYVITNAQGETLTDKNYQYNRDPRQFEAFLREAL